MENQRIVHPVLGLFYREGHVYGALLTVDAQGKVTEFFPISFHGITVQQPTMEDASAGSQQSIGNMYEAVYARFGG